MTKKTIEQLSDTDKFRAMLLKTSPAIQSNTSKYLIAAISSLMLGIVGVIVIIWIRPDYDILVVAGVIFAFLTPTTSSILTFIKAEETKKQAVETHLSVNSRLDAFIKQAAEASRLKGVQEGIDTANARTDTLAEKNK